MEYIKFDNDVNMPLVGLGTWDLRGDECVKAVSGALKIGYEMVDSASMYGNEAEVGKGIKESGIARDRIFVTTKIAYETSSYESTKKSIDNSLRVMGMDYLDLIMLHRPYRNSSEHYRALEDAYRAGKVRAIGVSNFNEKRYLDILNNNEIVPMVDQVEVHAYFQKWNLQETLNGHGTIMEAWSPLGGSGYTEKILSDPVVLDIAGEHGVTAGQVMLRFLVQRGIPVIPKSSHKERQLRNLDIFGFKLTKEEMERIRKMDKNKTLHSWTNAYN